MGWAFLLLAVEAAIILILMSLQIMGMIPPQIPPREAWMTGATVSGVAPTLGILGFGLVRRQSWARWAMVGLLGLLMIFLGVRMAWSGGLPVEFRPNHLFSISISASQLVSWLVPLTLLAWPAFGRDHRPVSPGVEQVRQAFRFLVVGLVAMEMVLFLLMFATFIMTYIIFIAASHMNPPVSLPPPPILPVPPPGA